MMDPCQVHSAFFVLSRVPSKEKVSNGMRNVHYARGFDRIMFNHELTQLKMCRL